MTYSATVQYLYGLQKHGIKLGLDNIRVLTARLEFPFRRYRTLHIAGTNGKGSTAAMAASMLQAAGYRVGLYTSPHLVDFRERIRVDGVMIPEAQVMDLTARLRSLADPDLAPTFFEFTTAMAFQHFAESAVDVAVLEVGMGGRFDATNVVNPVACAIITIALDHQEFLGNDLLAIAAEKSGIIKPSVPVVVGRVDDRVAAVIESVAAARCAPMARLGRTFCTQGESPDRFSYKGPCWRYEELSCGLAGRHQIDNAACAVALCEAAEACGLRVDEAAVRRGLRSVGWEGRLEVAARDPIVLLDGAHNPAAAAALAEHLRDFRGRNPAARIIAVLGMMRDKDRKGFMKPLRDLIDEAVLTQADIPRAATVDELHEVWSDFGVPLHRTASPADALAKARQLSSSGDVICITGSLMLVGDVKALLRGCGLSPLRG